MGRVSLTESYDDRSVIAKLNEMDKRVTENTTVVTAAEASAKASAQAAQETADRFAGSVGAVVQNANQQINASKAQVDQAKAEVDATVTTVAQAVQTADNASASAQQSAQTVAGYDTRLTAVENADTQNVKLTGEQTITGTKRFNYIIIPTSTGNYNGGLVIEVPDSLSTTDIITAKNNNSSSVLNFRLLKDSASTSLMTMIRTPSNQQKYTIFQVNDDGTQAFRGPSPYSGAPSDSYVTKGYVESTDGVTNNLVHRSANEHIEGRKNSAFVYNNYCEIDAFTVSRGGWHCIYDIGNQSRWIGELILARMSNANFAYRASKSSFEVCIETATSAFLKKNYVHGTTPSVKLCHDTNGWHILVNCPQYIRTFTRLDTEVYKWNAGDSTFKVSDNAEAVVTEPSAEQYDMIVDVTEW